MQRYCRFQVDTIPKNNDFLHLISKEKNHKKVT